MPLETLAAERTWFAVAPDGTEHDIVLRIGVPTCEPDGQWRATGSLGVLESRTHKIAGVYAWQAASLALRFAAPPLGPFSEDGLRLLLEPGGEPASPADP